MLEANMSQTLQTDINELCYHHIPNITYYVCAKYKYHIQRTIIWKIVTCLIQIIYLIYIEKYTAALLIHMYMYRTINIQRWCILIQAKSNALILPMLARLWTPIGRVVSRCVDESLGARFENPFFIQKQGDFCIT